MIGGAIGSAGRARRQTSQVARIPAPVQGLNLSRTFDNTDPLHCIFTYNMVPAERGLRTRKGYREWVTTLNDAVTGTVHTVIPYDGTLVDGTEDRLFAITQEGIWDATASTDAPVKVLAFADTNVDAGYGNYVQYVDDAGTAHLYYADSLNGLFEYQSGTDTWAAASGITGVDTTKVIFITSHKQRLWMVERDSTTGWYLGVGAVTGAATAFYFGSKLKHGGNLSGLFNWTVDGGEGVDDYLVAVGRGGDVLPYRGTDPSSADWNLHGSYYIGQVPNTPRYACASGGELYLLSYFGIISMNNLLQGVDTEVLRTDAQNASIAYKVAGIIREAMVQYPESREWALMSVPTEGGMLVSIPLDPNRAPLQLYYNATARGWGFWRDVPILCFDTWQDSIFFGTEDGRVCRMDVSVDNEELNPADPNINGNEIEFSILTTYSALGSEGVFKHPQLIRPDFVSSEPPVHSSLCRFDYAITEDFLFPVGDAPLVYTDAVWDISLWDAAIWSQVDGETYPSIGGSWGYGRYVAIATRGKVRARTRLIGWDLIYEPGGPMW